MDDVLEHLRPILTTTRDRWSSLVATVPATLLTRPPAAGEWAAAGCLRHLMDTERHVFPVRLRAFMAGEEIAAFDPDQASSSGDETPAELLAEFVRLRNENLALLDTVSEADTARTSVHSELGQVSLSELLHEWASHDLSHTIQAERALMQPFIAGTGPWRSIFAEYEQGDTP